MSRFPEWLKKKISAPQASSRYAATAALLRELGLETVCKNAHCPNQNECFNRGTATFMILGNTCTRSCSFCAVATGTPTAVDVDEPRRVAEAVHRMKLLHVVVTSVTRDDLSDKGSAHFARTIEAVRVRSSAKIEVLTPDFAGVRQFVKQVIEAKPDVFNHNVETIARLYAEVRPQADYKQSLAVLKMAKELDPFVITKSGLMVGLGETNEEIVETMIDLRNAGCEILTIGQYLAPSKVHHPVARFVTPEEFDGFAAAGKEMGFRAVASGPFVRSSYMAEAVFAQSARNKLPSSSTNKEDSKV